ncbi:MAG: putative membrane protein [Bradymonadia bacterium]|jgi:uncharacterized membrane protein
MLMTENAKFNLWKRTQTAAVMPAVGLIASGSLLAAWVINRIIECAGASFVAASWS